MKSLEMRKLGESAAGGSDDEDEASESDGLLGRGHKGNKREPRPIGAGRTIFTAYCCVFTMIVLLLYGAMVRPSMAPKQTKKLPAQRKLGGDSLAKGVQQGPRVGAAGGEPAPAAAGAPKGAAAEAPAVTGAAVATPAAVPAALAPEPAAAPAAEASPVVAPAVAAEAAAPPPPPPPPPPAPPPPPETPGDVPSGPAPEFGAIFHAEFPSQDSGLECLNKPRNANPAACGAACSAEPECRYFYAAASGRCCLKSAYVAGSALRKAEGDFYELTVRGPLPPPPPPEPPPPLAVQGAAPAVAVANGLRCVAPADAAYKVGQVTCTPATAVPGRSTDRVALVVVGQLKAAKEAVVVDSAHLLLAPLRRDFGDEGVDVYLCVDTPHAAEFAAPWQYGGLQPAAVFQVRFQ